jgi:hypothetical protein
MRLPFVVVYIFVIADVVYVYFVVDVVVLSDAVVYIQMGYQNKYSSIKPMFNLHHMRYIPKNVINDL